MNLIFLSSVFILLLYICVIDFTQRKVTNNSIVSLFFLLSYLYVDNLQISVMINTGLILLIGFILFSVNVIAAGDTKLLVVMSLAIDSQYLVAILLLMALCGGLLALIYYLYGVFTDMAAVRKRGIPYGIPISISGYIGIAASLS